MINGRLYQEIVLPFFNVKHGQFVAVALTRSGANKLLRKVWESFVSKRDNTFEGTSESYQRSKEV